ncbi:MAG: hypothetical protein IPH52_15630 [Leptospiraceae bacterium]|nr:hypothetical protein [Leptospiraceae bacterium]
MKVTAREDLKDLYEWCDGRVRIANDYPNEYNFNYAGYKDLEKELLPDQVKILEEKK